MLDKSKQLKKELSLFNIYAIATGTTIASGFFLLPGLAFKQAGPAMILSYLIAVIPVIPALFSKAELATAMPRAGGVYFFLDRSMGPLMGTIGGVGTWLALILKTSFALIGVGAYMGIFFPDIQIVPFAIGFAVLFGIINLLGAKKTGSMQNILVIGLLGLLVVFFGSSFSEINFSYFRGLFETSAGSLLSTAGLVYVSYVGLSKIASVSEEVKNPERNIPLAMFMALGTILVVYLLGTIAIVGLIPPEELSGALTPVAMASEKILGPFGAVLMTLAAVFAFFSVANAGILSASRYPLAMSRDHLMPSVLRKFSKKQIPQNAVVVTTGIIILILLSFDPTKIAKLAGAFQLMLFSLISVAVIVMRESKIESYDPGYRSPFYPWMQIIGIISPWILIFQLGMLPILVTLGILAISTFWYFYYGRDKVVRDGAIYHIFARLGERRFEGLDSELRGILKEKGIRDKDPFNAVIASASVIDVAGHSTFEDVVKLAAEKLSPNVHTKIENLVSGFMEGTMVGATPVSHGVALPHLRVKDIQGSELVMVRSHAGIKVDLNSEYLSDQVDEPINAFFFLVSPEDNPGQHLRILAQIASHADDRKFKSRWLEAKNDQEMKELLLRDDQYISIRLKPDQPCGKMIGQEIRDLGLPAGSLVALIHRNNAIIFPRGKTVLEEDDRLTIIGEPDGIKQLYSQYVDVK